MEYFASSQYKMQKMGKIAVFILNDLCSETFLIHEKQYPFKNPWLFYGKEVDIGREHCDLNCVQALPSEKGKVVLYTLSLLTPLWSCLEFFHLGKAV